MSFGFTPYALVQGAGALVALSAAVIAWRRRHTPGGTVLALMMTAVTIWAMSVSLEQAVEGISSAALFLQSRLPGRGQRRAPVRHFHLEVSPCGQPCSTPGRGHSLGNPPGRAGAGRNQRPARLRLERNAARRSLAAPGARDRSGLVGPGSLRLCPHCRGHGVRRQSGAERAARPGAPRGAHACGSHCRLGGRRHFRRALQPFPRAGRAGDLFLPGRVAVPVGAQGETLELSPVARSILVEAMPDGLIVEDGWGRVVDANPSALSLLGKDRSIFGTPLDQALGMWPELAALVSRAGDGDMEVLRRDDRFFELTVSTLRGPHGRQVGRMVSLRDVSERRRAEEATRERERNLRALLSAAQRQAKELALLDQVRTSLTAVLDLPLLFRTVVEGIARRFRLHPGEPLPPAGGRAGAPAPGGIHAGHRAACRLRAGSWAVSSVRGGPSW